MSLASDFMWNWNAREATASFGYDYMLRQCRLRGRIDSEGKVGSAQDVLVSALCFHSTVVLSPDMCRAHDRQSMCSSPVNAEA